MTQKNRAAAFRDLHIAGEPLVLYNIWDAGGAKALAEAGAKAVATSSWAMAAAHGYADGEKIPFNFVVSLVERIAQATDLPLTVDFEGGYAEAPDEIAANTTRLLAIGAVGLNFEDRIVNGTGLYPVSDQVERIKAIRAAADDNRASLFVNARTDLFLNADPADHATLIDDALSRCEAYAEAGADGFFVPGLTDYEFIRQVCEQSALPINVLMARGLTSVSEVAPLGIARASFGHVPYVKAMEDFSVRLGAIPS